jgi:hypothetical protein
VIHFCLNVGRHGFAKLHFKKKLLTIAFKRLYPFPLFGFQPFFAPFLFCPTTPRLRPCLGVEQNHKKPNQKPEKIRAKLSKNKPNPNRRRTNSKNTQNRSIITLKNPKIGAKSGRAAKPKEPSGDSNKKRRKNHRILSENRL